MKTLCSEFLIVTIVAISLFVAPCLPAADPVVSDPVKKQLMAEIQQFMEAREAAWQKKDLAALSAQFAEDAERWDARGNRQVGRKKISENYEKVFNSPEHAEIKYDHSVQQVQLITPTVALVDADWIDSGTKDLKGNAQPPRKGHLLTVLRKSKEKWEIVSLRGSFLGSPEGLK
jgi:uncharacterized protein (TIGR02246 family)